MKKITDVDYFLPNIIPSNKNQSCKGGATLPIIITGTCSKTYLEDDYVLKFRSGEGMTYHSCIKELLGSFIAMELELNVVEPVIINLVSDFVDTIDILEEKKIAQNSLGYNYGSKFLTGLNPLYRDMEIYNDLRKEAIKVFIFDIMINNIDRNYRKPNMLTDGNKIYIFDHEKAFSFMEVLVFFRNQSPWLLDTELIWIKNHFFWKEFKSRIIEIESFIDKLSCLSDDFWNKAEKLIPQEWSDKSDYFIGIKDHFIKIVQNKDVFKEEIERILA